MTATITPATGGVCAVKGFRAAGITAGLKPSGKPDMAMVAADRPVAAAGVQTTNQVRAAPVTVTEHHLANGQAQAVLLNAGNANVCTGPAGIQLATDAAAAAAQRLGASPEDVLVCSTGIIGVNMPPKPYLDGAAAVVDSLAASGNTDAATAIMTTDLVPKEAAVQVSAGDDTITIGGMVKGSGMIAPAMATMLCVITTDVPFPAEVLESALRRAVAQSFNRVSVDGCMSTNDAVLLLSTQEGASGVDPPAFTEALTAVCRDLAEQMVADGEGATRTLRVRVTSARTEDDAVAVGRQVGINPLVQTALAGSDPNWGRVMGAIGAGTVPVEPSGITIGFADPAGNQVTVADRGMAADFDHDAAVKIMTANRVECRIDLGQGDAEGDFLTCDFTHGYITINAEYTT